MEITPHDITVRELVNGYENNEDDGVVGFGGLLNIRPKYQREFVYTENQQREVIYSIFKGYPLNVMYWVKNEDGIKLVTPKTNKKLHIQLPNAFPIIRSE